jgi:hypothetical protein
MNLVRLIILSFCLIAAGCGSCRSTVKEKINSASQNAGATAAEVVKGVKRGIENSFEILIDKSKDPRLATLSLGKTTLTNGEGGSDNRLSVYVIFNAYFKGEIQVKVFDKNGLEMGRNTQTVTGKANDAKYIDFVFDQRTNIDSDSKLMMEQITNR